MAFIALGFVLLGTFIIFYSLFFYLQKDIKVKTEPNNGRTVRTPYQEQSKESSIQKQPGREKEPALNNEYPWDKKVFQNSAYSQIDHEHEYKKELPGTNLSNTIVFRGRSLYYEDHSGINRYDGSDIDLDETLSSYQRFYRIGEGMLSLTESALTFQNDEKVFHLSFEDTKNFIFYQNCVVILSRKEKIVRIFFPDKYSLFRTVFREMIEQEYSERKDEVYQK